jgi:hypothetical protein
MAAEKKVSGKRFNLSIPENDEEFSMYTDLTGIFESGEDADLDSDENDDPELASLPEEIKVERRTVTSRGGRRKNDRRSGVDRRQVGYSIDPMNIYLKEMGNLSLLTHEEEVALAQLIEHGEMRVQQAVLSMRPGVDMLNNLAHGVREEKIKIGAVLKGLSDNDETAAAKIQDNFLKAVE